ncbi:hypothetical protein [Achromobacter aloeverae]|nr:hypothetical protein [Achromobacter aloeverae]
MDAGSVPASAPSPAAPAASATASAAAHWRPASLADVRAARALCAEHGVAMALAGTRGQAAGRSCLWVDPRALDTLRCLDDVSPSSASASAARWRAAPGVTMAMLADAGLAQFAALPADMTVAAWLAGRRRGAGSGRFACPPGLVSVDAMLADGALETLGPFGASGGLPLRSASGQALIPALYTLSTRAGAGWCRAQARWPARYRLDALMPPPPAEANLAGLLAGHEGALAWVESVVLQAVPDHERSAAGGAVTSPAACPSADLTKDADGGEAPAYPAEARALDAHIKDVFDPAGLFPDAPTP